MIPSDTDLVDITALLYDPSNDRSWDKIWPVDGSYCAAKQVNQSLLIVDRGSETPKDWAENFNAVPVYDKLLDAHVEQGFLNSTLLTAAAVEAYIGERPAGTPIILLGHSLGAARALLRGARLHRQGRTPTFVSVYGPPRVGFQHFVDIYGNIPHKGWINEDANGHDLVTDVPPGIFDKLFQQMRLVECSAAPKPNDPWLAFAYHHIQLYQAGIRAMS